MGKGKPRRLEEINLSLIQKSQEMNQKKRLPSGFYKNGVEDVRHS